MTTENDQPQEDSLDDFSKEFFGQKTEEADNPGNEAPATEDALEDEEEDTVEEIVEAPEPPKKKKSAQERIDEITAKEKQAARERDALQKERDDLFARLDALEKNLKPVEKEEVKEAPKGPQPGDLDDDGNPKYDLGEYDPLYIRDLTRYETQRATEEMREALKAEREAEVANEKLNAEKTALTTQWQEKLAKAEESLPDIREKGLALTDTFSGIDEGYGEYLVSAIMSMEHGPEVLYYLSDNVDEAQRIVASGPVAATIALGRLEAQFTGTTKQKVKVTEAPEPPQQVSRGASGKFEVPDDTDDLTAFAKKFYQR